MNYLDLANKVAHRWIKATTTALPDSFPDSEIGLMTVNEFLGFRNPERKYHDSGAYDWDIYQMNRDLGLRYIDKLYLNDDIFTFYESDNGGILIKKGRKKSSPTVGVIKGGTLFYEDRKPPPTFLDMHEREKRVKYLSEYVPLVSDPIRDNFRNYPHLLRRLKIKGEAMELRAESQPSQNEGTALAVFNREGQVVAKAQDEWGATLLAVADEYRGRGLGKVIGKWWYKFNPDYKSGGFTSSGQANAMALWEQRVQEFLANGWYSELIRQGRLSQDRLKIILRGLKGRKRAPTLPKYEDKSVSKSRGTEPLVYVDGDKTAFAVYDHAFLDKPDEDFIYGYGFFRTTSVGPVLYRIDYEREYQELTTNVALQMARNKGERLYDGEGYSDMLELGGMKNVERDGDYIYLTKDVLPLDVLIQKERRIRNKVDKYGEKRILLIEMAESKWS